MSVPLTSRLLEKRNLENYFHRNQVEDVKVVLYCNVNALVFIRRNSISPRDTGSIEANLFLLKLLLNYNQHF